MLCDAGLGPFPRTGTFRLTQHASGIVRFARNDPLTDRHIRADDSDATRGKSLVQIPHACAAPAQQHVKTGQKCCNTLSQTLLTTRAYRSLAIPLK